MPQLKHLGATMVRTLSVVLEQWDRYTFTPGDARAQQTKDQLDASHRNPQADAFKTAYANKIVTQALRLLPFIDQTIEETQEVGQSMLYTAFYQLDLLKEYTDLAEDVSPIDISALVGVDALENRSENDKAKRKLKAGSGIS